LFCSSTQPTAAGFDDHRQLLVHQDAGRLIPVKSGRRKLDYSFSGEPCYFAVQFA
jgi:hypothetical protein